jgi:hypothetical protein
MMELASTVSPASRSRHARVKVHSSLSGMLDDSSSSFDLLSKPVELRHPRHHPKSVKDEALQTLALNLRRTKRRLLLAAVSNSNAEIHQYGRQDSDESKEDRDLSAIQTRIESFG